MDFGHAALSLILILLGAKLFGELAERIGQPPVLGELVAGIILGGSVLGWVGETEFVTVLAGFGAVLLLFEVGLESDLEEFLRVGASALMVAVVGVIGPFAVGYVVALLFNLSHTTALFIGATLTATSVGITARTLTDLGHLRTAEAKIILGAAVIDDVLGLIILAVVVALVEAEAVSACDIGRTVILAVVFLVGAILIGVRIAPRILAFVRNMRTRGMLTACAFVFCLALALAAEHLRLAGIVGAFAAGLVLAKTEDHVHIQDRIRPLADILIPVFFVSIGMKVNLHQMNPLSPGNSDNAILALVLTAVACVMKLGAGLGVLRRGVDRLVVGIGMIPRGEVGLIFAVTGLQRGVINDAQYTAVVTLVVVTTFITPPLLKSAFQRYHRKRKLPKQPA